jgi:hypothetical protein
MTKVINANTPWGQYRIPAALVARNRANYYASKGDDYVSEFEYAMDDNYELIDWLLNNMDWADVKDRAEKFSDKVFCIEGDFWTDSEDFWVVEVS